MSTLEAQAPAQAPATRMEHRSDLAPDFSLGLEEELLIVDPSGEVLQPQAELLLRAARPPSNAGKLCAEIFASELELVTPICTSVDQAASALARLLSSVLGTGATVIGSGLHPMATVDDARLFASPRYEALASALGGLLRAPPAALHVHVGLPDPEAAIRACNGLRRHLPLLHSLGANSPFWYGRDSGLASARAAILRSYPRYAVPRWFRDWEDFSQVAHDLALAAGVPDYTYFRWDVRPHPRLGTVEVRAPNAQFSLERTTALASLIHALVRMDVTASAGAYRSRDALAESCYQATRYQATRYGLDARVPDDGGRLRPARLLALQTVRRAMPHAIELGCADALAGVERIVEEGNGADVQRRIEPNPGCPASPNGWCERAASHGS